VFHDADYVKWANENTVHALSYSLDKNATTPEPVLDVERNGEKTEVLAMYPMFSKSEADDLVNELDGKVKFPTHTPWVGVIALDGTTVLATAARGTSKQYRELYEAEQKKLGVAVPRSVWQRVRKLLDTSASADLDEKYAEAIKAVLDAKATVKDAPKALAEKIASRLEALDDIGRTRLEDAGRLRDLKARDAAIAKVKSEFAGLPFLAAK
jgi:hypothetical protein